MRKALAHVRRAYHLWEPMTDYSGDWIAHAELKESFRALIFGLKERSECQLGLTVGKRVTREIKGDR
jgi:hypothetical protein